MFAKGKRGFADASAVGAGKTLTALAVLTRAAAWLDQQKISRSGSLVLVPTNSLVGEWCQQVRFGKVRKKLGGRILTWQGGSADPPTHQGCARSTSAAQVSLRLFFI